MSTAQSAPPRAFERYVAIGDSSTEGLEDPDPSGNGRHRGWADRLAEHIARSQKEPLLYANLAIRGRKTREVLEEQLPIALAMKPDLASAFVGTNDAIQPKFDAERVGADLREMWGALRATGATVFSLTLPDLSSKIPLGKPLSGRIAELNRVTREAAKATGVILVDLADHPIATDPRIWHSDRLHANAIGHERVAAAIAHELRIPGVPHNWDAPLPSSARVPSDAAATVSDRVKAEARWARDYLLPWMGRRLSGRSSGDGLTPKRPWLAPVELSTGDPARSGSPRSPEQSPR
jgi:lysophospholipase L1-like esterase